VLVRVHCDSSDEEGALMAQGQNNRRLARTGQLLPLPSKPRVSHVTSSLALAPSSLLICGVRNSHKYLAFCKIFRGIWPMPNAPLPPESFRTCFACATHAHSAFPLLASARSIGFGAIWVCISSNSSSNYILRRNFAMGFDTEWPY
jgi:hypothetical protein